MHFAAFDAELIIRERKPIMLTFFLKVGYSARPANARRFGDLQHPRELVAFHRVPLAPQGGVRRLRQGGVGFPGIIRLLPWIQGPVVPKARRPRRLAEIRLLPIVGIEGNFMSQNHDDASSPTCFTPSSNF